MTQAISFSQFIALDKETLKGKFLHCCHCDSWATTLTDEIATTSSLEDLKKLMSETWSTASEEDYLEAFSAHPKIGDIKVLQDKFAVQAHAEQGQVKQASQETLESLMVENDRYFDKFGFIFIICATGKSADEMLSALTERLENDRAAELQNAADEQEKIMFLRLAQIILE